MDGAHYTSVDGKQASADQIEVLMTAGQPFITLLGNARVSDGANSLTGPQIQVASAEQKATIIGAGTLQVQGDAIQPDQASRNEQSADVHPSAQPVTVQWQQGVVVDGKANRIDVNKSVVITTAQADGTTHTIRGDQLVMLLQDAPADRAPKNRISQTARFWQIKWCARPHSAAKLLLTRCVPVKRMRFCAASYCAGACWFTIFLPAR